MRAWTSSFRSPNHRPSGSYSAQESLFWQRILTLYNDQTQRSVLIAALSEVGIVIDGPGGGGGFQTKLSQKLSLVMAGHSTLLPIAGADSI